MRIGLVLNVLNEEYQISVFKGVKHQAELLDIELVCFQLEGVPFSYSTFANQFPINKVFNLDGIILITSSVIDSHLLKTKAQLQKLWKNIPIISLGQGIHDVPSILIQSNTSMKILVEHLIREHNYKKFLFIQGPEHHEDAKERRYIFEKTMDIYKAYNPDIVYSEEKGNFVETDGSNAIAAYYKKNKSFPDVVVCANDNMAIGVNKYLQMNQDKIKKTCAVTGFDDVPQGQFMVPPLSTIHQPLEESGSNAVLLIKDLINKKDVKTINYVEAKVVLRESCGCKKQKVLEASSTEKLAKLQRDFIQSERFLKILNFFGQDLIFCDSYEYLQKSCENYFSQLEVPEYYIFAFSEYIQPESIVAQEKIEVLPIFLKNNDYNFSKLYTNKKIKLTDIIATLQNDYGFSLKNKTIKYLNNASSLIGFVVFKDDLERLPFLCSITVTLSQTLFRIKNIEQEKKRAEYLENEITKRTSMLVKANNQRMKVEAEVLRISEIERQRFSLDLHDDICQRLAGIAMLCRSYSKKEDGSNKEEMIELSELINDTLTRTRQYAHNSYPVELQDFSLTKSINNLCNSFGMQNGIPVSFVCKIDDSISFTNTEKLNIFRIIQESLHNVYKHAQAKNVIVKIEKKANKVKFYIIDDGNGLKKEQLKNKGLGLTSMQYRANQIGAELSIKNNSTIDQKGTTVELILPR